MRSSGAERIGSGWLSAMEVPAMPCDLPHRAGTLRMSTNKIGPTRLKQDKAPPAPVTPQRRSR